VRRRVWRTQGTKKAHKAQSLFIRDRLAYERPVAGADTLAATHAAVRRTSYFVLVLPLRNIAPVARQRHRLTHHQPEKVCVKLVSARFARCVGWGGMGWREGRRRGEGEPAACGCFAAVWTGGADGPTKHNAVESSCFREWHAAVETAHLARSRRHVHSLHCGRAGGIFPHLFTPRVRPTIPAESTSSALRTHVAFAVQTPARTKQMLKVLLLAAVLCATTAAVAAAAAGGVANPASQVHISLGADARSMVVTWSTPFEVAALFCFSGCRREEGEGRSVRLRCSVLALA
jgi:hypothetical protein